MLYPSDRPPILQGIIRRDGVFIDIKKQGQQTIAPVVATLTATNAGIVET